MPSPAPRPAVSVIIPVYNAEKYLRECLDSVLGQSLKEIEVICVDDGSTDNSPQILEEYAAGDYRFFIIHKTNSGYGASVNLGIEQAQGCYITILEPDDKLSAPEAYACLLESAQKHDVDVVKGDYNFYWSNNLKRPANALRACPKNIHTNARKCNNLFAIPLSVWTAFYKRDFLKRENIRFLETPGASYQDNAFSFKVFACAESVVLINKAIVDYRQDNTDSSTKSKTKVFCIVDEIHEIERWLSEDPEREKNFSYDKWLFHYKAYFANLQRAPKEKRQDFFTLFRKEFLDAQAKRKLPKELFLRLGNRLPLLLASPQKFLFYFRLRMMLDAFRRTKKHLLGRLSRIHLLS